MIYHGGSYKIDFENNQFDSSLELTWFLFLTKSEISKNVISHPLDYKYDLNWYPDIQFSFFAPKYFQIYAEVKPLLKSEFHTELNLKKYTYPDKVVCLLGETNYDYLFLSNDIDLKAQFDTLIHDKDYLWRECRDNSMEIAKKYGSFKKNDFVKSDLKLTFGKYEGFTLKEVKERNLEYYNWYLKKFEE